MIDPYMQTALADLRRSAFLAQTEAARQARQARLHRQPTGMPGARSWSSRWLRSMLRPGRKGVIRGPRAAAGQRAVLRDGSAVLIRPVQPADAPLVADAFTRLSLKSRQQRFLTPKQELSAAELRYLTDIDHHDHEALAAVSRTDGRGVGIARYVRRAEDPQTGEIAVTVVDEWQGRGLGAELLARLSDRARQEGICRFTALVSAENAAVRGLLRSASADLVRRDSSDLEYEITLTPGEAGVPDSAGEPDTVVVHLEAADFAFQYLR
jgi:RimJ/RimL family protein N-acetyltransferase